MTDLDQVAVCQFSVWHWWANNWLVLMSKATKTALLLTLLMLQKWSFISVWFFLLDFKEEILSSGLLSTVRFVRKSDCECETKQQSNFNFISYLISNFNYGINLMIWFLTFWTDTLILFCMYLLWDCMKMSRDVISSESNSICHYFTAPSINSASQQ